MFPHKPMLSIRRDMRKSSGSREDIERPYQPERSNGTSLFKCAHLARCASRILRQDAFPAKPLRFCHLSTLRRTPLFPFRVDAGFSIATSSDSIPSMLRKVINARAIALNFCSSSLVMIANLFVLVSGYHKEHGQRKYWQTIVDEPERGFEFPAQDA